ncbi:MAG: hypothetical protein K0S65_1147 [Labilithrix sp.]|nr:hypothetical protein [Labilithrix sp.]
MTQIRRLFAVAAFSLTTFCAQLAGAHGADVVMMEARIDGADVDAIAYLGQKPVMRMVAGRDDRPVNEETIATHAKAIVDHSEKNIGFRTKDGACEPGPVLRLDKDPDGQAVRLVRRYRCHSIGKDGVEVEFRPFFDYGPQKIFLLGIFFADGKTQAHTFTGRPITIHPETFREPGRADRLALFPALFPAKQAPTGSGGQSKLLVTGLLGLGVLGIVGLVARRQLARRRVETVVGSEAKPAA